eukprot:CAMPEP_0114587236 /NCGR_PEP_ID=MMETSP0125-20121206/10249_1 /TAXON_ID=485358 ORGANISM="Aristerostoma sp., Strain ATCC 50986" /NCGR_SAMPLE_ID=MMETSP0125 /ASSEMBLY_ACC=CAM_ASM_000245 /LENGTH=69 /DNA_ID=CAMNT_0001783051 /DNA_START=82 /DNA_END=291 /DNA_ORIENTATION=-
MAAKSFPIRDHFDFEQSTATLMVPSDGKLGGVYVSGLIDKKYFDELKKNNIVGIISVWDSLMGYDSSID